MREITRITYATVAYQNFEYMNFARTNVRQSQSKIWCNVFDNRSLCEKYRRGRGRNEPAREKKQVHGRGNDGGAGRATRTPPCTRGWKVAVKLEVRTCGNETEAYRRRPMDMRCAMQFHHQVEYHHTHQLSQEVVKGGKRENEILARRASINPLSRKDGVPPAGVLA